MRFRLTSTAGLLGGLAAALLLVSGCDNEAAPEPDPEPVTGVVGGCEMTYSETDAGISTCLCSDDGITAGATVSAYRVEPQHGPDGELNPCPLSSEGQPPTASGVTDAEGRYALSVPPGRYSIFHTAGCADLLPPTYRYYYACEDVTEPLTLDINPCHGIGCLPNLYLYPSQAMPVSVRLAGGRGAALLTQHPSFTDVHRWDVYVEPGSRNLQSSPGFLFYEARVGQPYKSETTTGWVVPPHGFGQWAQRTLTDLGWPASPQQDFLDAWSTRLDRDHAIAIRFIPQRWVHERVGLIIDPIPDRTHRHWFLIEEARPGERLQPPTLPPFDSAPSTLTVLEWGVIDHLSRP